MNFQNRIAKYHQQSQENTFPANKCLQQSQQSQVDQPVNKRLQQSQHTFGKVLDDYVESLRDIHKTIKRYDNDENAIITLSKNEISASSTTPTKNCVSGKQMLQTTANSNSSDESSDESSDNEITEDTSVIYKNTADGNVSDTIDEIKPAKIDFNDEDAIETLICDVSLSPGASPCVSPLTTTETTQANGQQLCQMQETMQETTEDLVDGKPITNATIVIANTAFMQANGQQQDLQTETTETTENRVIADGKLVIPVNSFYLAFYKQFCNKHFSYEEMCFGNCFSKFDEDECEFIGMFHESAINNTGLRYFFNVIRKDFDKIENNDCGNMFYHCENITELPEGLTLKNVVDGSEMFAMCYNLKIIPNTVTLENLIEGYHMFFYCESIENLPNSVTLKSLINGSSMFRYCIRLVTLPATITLSKLLDSSNMFDYCESLQNLPSSITFASVTATATTVNPSNSSNATSNSSNAASNSSNSATSNYSNSATTATVITVANITEYVDVMLVNINAANVKLATKIGGDAIAASTYMPDTFANCPCLLSLPKTIKSNYIIDDFVLTKVYEHFFPLNDNYEKCKAPPLTLLQQNEDFRKEFEAIRSCYPIFPILM